MGAWHKDDTLCWNCRYAYGGHCRWISDGEEVDGWVADKCEYVAAGVVNNAPTYVVRRCPEFQKWNSAYDNGGPEKLDTMGCLDLIAAMIRTMRNDYIDEPDQRVSIERFMRGKVFARLGCGVDGNKAVDVLRRDAKAFDLQRKKAELLFGTRLREMRDKYVTNTKARQRIRELLADEEKFQNRFGDLGVSPAVMLRTLRQQAAVYDRRMKKKRDNERTKARLAAQRKEWEEMRKK